MQLINQVDFEEALFAAESAITEVKRSKGEVVEDQPETEMVMLGQLDLFSVVMPVETSLPIRIETVVDDPAQELASVRTQLKKARRLIFDQMDTCGACPHGATRHEAAWPKECHTCPGRMQAEKTVAEIERLMSKERFYKRLAHVHNARRKRIAR